MKSIKNELTHKQMIALANEHSRNQRKDLLVYFIGSHRYKREGGTKLPFHKMSKQQLASHNNFRNTHALKANKIPIKDLKILHNQLIVRQWRNHPQNLVRTIKHFKKVMSKSCVTPECWEVLQTLSIKTNSEITIG